MTYDEIREILDGREWTADSLKALLQAYTWYAGNDSLARMIAETTWAESEDQGDLTPPLLLSDWAKTVGQRPPAIIDGLIDANACILLCGRPKAGKTFFALELAEAVATGADLLGRWEVTRPGPVIYYSMEDSPYQFRDRWQQRGSIDRAPDVYVWRGRKDLRTATGMAWLMETMEHIDPSLLIVDTARQAFDVGNWNDAAEVNRAFQPVVEAAHQLPNGASIVIVAHTNKGVGLEAGTRISGSNALQSIVDGYIVLDKTKRNLVGDLEGEAECEGRIHMPPKFSWAMDQHTLRVTALDTDESAARERQRAEQEKAEAAHRLGRIVDQMGGTCDVSMVAAALNMSERTAKDRLRAAVRLGVLAEAMPGEYCRNHGDGVMEGL